MTSHLRAHRTAFGAFMTVLALPAIAAGQGLAAPAHPTAIAAPAHHRVVALAGSSRYLVYRQFTLVDGKAHYPAELYALTAAGRREDLGTIATRFDTGYSLSGSTLFAHDDAGTELYLWDLRTGRAQTLHAPSGTFPIAAAPDGYIAGKVASDGSGPTRLDLVSRAGAITRLGSPFPDGQPYGVIVGPSSYVAFAQRFEQKGGIVAGQFAHPGRIHPLLAPGAGASFCGAPDAQYVACRLNVYVSQGPTRLYNLTGGLVAKTSKHCQGAVGPTPAVLLSSAFWIDSCASGVLRELDKNGRLTHSLRTFDGGIAPINALHQIVVTNHARTALIGVTSAAGKPHTLVRVG